MKYLKKIIFKNMYESNPFWRFNSCEALKSKKLNKNKNVVVVGNGGYAHTLRALIANMSMFGEDRTRLYWRNRVHGISVESLGLNEKLTNIPSDWMFSHRTYRSWTIPYLCHQGGNLLEEPVFFNAMNKSGMWGGVGEYRGELKILKEIVSKLFVNNIQDCKIKNDNKINPSLSIHVRTWYDLPKIFPINEMINLDGVIAREKFDLNSLCLNISSVLDRYDIDRSRIYLASDNLEASEYIKSKLLNKFRLVFINETVGGNNELLSTMLNDFYGMVNSNVILRSKGTSFSHLAGLIGPSVIADHVF
jgi:hypothetical protein